MKNFVFVHVFTSKMLNEEGGGATRLFGNYNDLATQLTFCLVFTFPKNIPFNIMLCQNLLKILVIAVFLGC